MKLKSLLIGSAAALVATGGAQAADVMMEDEMEPVEYVRVCDAYGSGFFYIPGSETCLRFDGYARYQINANEDQFSKGYRFRLNVDARSDTDWGTLRGFGRLQATGGDSSDAAFTADQLIIQLGGFHAGYTESAFVAPWGGPGIARFGVLHTDGGGSYAYQQRQQIGYTWAGADGFSATIALEDDDNTTARTTLADARTALAGAQKTFDDADAAFDDAQTTLGRPFVAGEGDVEDTLAEGAHKALADAIQARTDATAQEEIDAARNALTNALVELAAAQAARDNAQAAVDKADTGGDGFVPDVTGVIGFSHAWGGIYAKGGFDESASAGTVMAGIHINVPDAPGSSFRAGVFYATDPNAYAPHAPLGDIVLPAGVDGIDTEWSVAASYKHQFTPAFSGVLGGQYFEDFHGDNSYLIQGAVVRVPVADQAEIWLESAYEDHDAADDGEWSGFLRFRRYF